MICGDSLIFPVVGGAVVDGPAPPGAMLGVAVEVSASLSAISLSIHSLWAAVNSVSALGGSSASDIICLLAANCLLLASLLANGVPRVR